MPLNPHAANMTSRTRLLIPLFGHFQPQTISTATPHPRPQPRCWYCTGGTSPCTSPLLCALVMMKHMSTAPTRACSMSAPVSNRNSQLKSFNCSQLQPGLAAKLFLAHEQVSGACPSMSSLQPLDSVQLVGLVIDQVLARCRLFLATATTSASVYALLLCMHPTHLS
jgi:hypothetical protein